MNKNFFEKYARIIYSFAFIGVMAMSGCGGFNAYPVEDDVKLGKQIATDIERNPKEYPLYNNPDAVAYIQGMVNEILKSPEIKYRKVFAYRAHIIKDDKTINAFCTPGGYIYVYTGLIKAVDNEATLAAVLGHEIAHAERRHSTQQLTKAQGVEVLSALLLGDQSNALLGTAAELFSGLALLKYGRDAEYESDEYSYKYLKATRWYPAAMVNFFRAVSGRKQSEVEVLMSTHPAGQDRIERVEKMAKADKLPAPTEANLFKEKYKTLVRLVN